MREIKFLAYVNNPIHGKGVFPVKSIHFDPFVCEVVLRHHLEFEIVGNIFEHPHLLEAKGNE